MYVYIILHYKQLEEDSDFNVKSTDRVLFAQKKKENRSGCVFSLEVCYTVCML